MGAEKLNPWLMAQAALRDLLDEHSYENWLGQTRYESYDDGVLVVNVPSHFFAKWLREHFDETIHNAVREVLPDFKDVRFVPSKEMAPKDSPHPNANGTNHMSVPASERGTATESVKEAVSRRDGLSPRYTFDRFVIGGGNRFAHAAAKAVVESPARAYNPLFLYGSTGLGKTHLMHAMGHELLRKNPDLNIVFITSELFTNQLIESIAKKSTFRFRAKYRKADILLIDDIHFIAGKEATQEEFFHTFNELYDAQKQIVLSSDRSPKEMQGMESRLVSRFEWGLVTDIQPPDFETRMAILQNKAADEGMKLKPEVIRYIATVVTSNIRELEGALVTLTAYSKLARKEVDIPLVEQVLHDLIGSARIKPITLERVQKVVADDFDVRISDLRGHRRQRQISRPRQIAMYLCKELIPSMTLSEIGEAFGGKDHTTVLYACDKIARELGEDEKLRQTMGRLEKSIRV